MSISADQRSLEKVGEVQDEQSIFVGGSAEIAKREFRGEPGRYHLYASLACPWAHKTLIARRMKGLESAVSCTVVDWAMGDDGWAFSDTTPQCTPDINGYSYLRQVYALAAGGGGGDYPGKVTVPVLWDKVTKKIVSNESADIVRFFNSSFDGLSRSKLDLRPKQLESEIDLLNEWISSDLNHGVYRAGLAATQAEYDAEVAKVFEALDRADGILADRRYLTGSRLTEPDLALFVTLVRFDAVYFCLFKCNVKRIADYENLWPYLRDVYQTDGVQDTVDLEHIKRHYETSQTSVNPHGIVSAGPRVDLQLPHSRHLLGNSA